MARGAKKGEVRNPKGRGSAPNKATTQAREAIAAFVEGNVERLNGWLDEIAATDGAKDAFNCFMSVVEYHIPKLQRTQYADAQDNDMVVFVPMFGRNEKEEQ